MRNLNKRFHRTLRHLFEGERDDEPPESLSDLLHEAGVGHGPDTGDGTLVVLDEEAAGVIPAPTDAAGPEDLGIDERDAPSDWNEEAHAPTDQPPAGATGLQECLSQLAQLPGYDGVPEEERDEGPLGYGPTHPDLDAYPLEPHDPFEEDEQRPSSHPSPYDRPSDQER